MINCAGEWNLTTVLTCASQLISSPSLPHSGISTRSYWNERRSSLRARCMHQPFSRRFLVHQGGGLSSRWRRFLTVPPARERGRGVDGDGVVGRRGQQGLLRGGGEDVDLVAEPCQRARLVPGVGPDPAEAGLGRVFEGEEGDSHRRNVDIEWISDHLGIGKFNNKSAFRQAEDSKEITSKRSQQRSTVTFSQLIF